jgi:hypothetical protein
MPPCFSILVVVHCGGGTQSLGNLAITLEADAVGSVAISQKHRPLW